MMANAVLLSLAIVVAGLVAGIIPLFFQWSHRTAHRWIAFGAGTILGVAFLHMIPEAIELAGTTGFAFLLVGFLVLYGIEQLSLKHPHEEDEGELHEIGVLAVIGFGLHNLIDGIALGSGDDMPILEGTIFLAVLLHKIPTIFSLSVLLVHGDYTRRRIIGFLLMILLAIPAGTILARLFVDAFDSPLNIGRLIFFSAGTFIYIGAYELLPEMHRKSREDRFLAIFFGAGLLLMALIGLRHVGL